MRWRTSLPVAITSSALWLAQVRAAYVDPAVLDACSGYVVKSEPLLSGGTRSQIDLSLKQPGCEVFGSDIENLRLTVTYETGKCFRDSTRRNIIDCLPLESRLHVKIVDASKARYEVPDYVFPRPQSKGVSPKKHKLAFKYTTDPFTFTVSRRRTGEVLFSTHDYPLIFEDQFIRVKTSLPEDANVYGLGEHTDGLRLDFDNFGRGLTRTLWSRDSYGLPNGTNLYGNHPVYFEHRMTGTHGVFLLNSNGMDVKLNKTTSGSSLEYNVIGGVLDFYFLAGSESDPEAVSKQYAEVSGLPAEVPYWGLGFHQCRFGYKGAWPFLHLTATLRLTRHVRLDYVDLAGVISKYKASGIPLETMWADIG